MKFLNSRRFKLSRLAVGIVAIVGGVSPVCAFADVKFNPDFLNNTVGQDVDISRFNGEYRIEPGEYQPDVYLNGRLVDRADVKVRNIKGTPQLCFTDSLATRLKLNRSRLTPAALASLASSEGCASLENLITGASARLVVSDMRLDVAIPQAFLNQRARGYVPSSMWSYGEKALYLSYGANYFEQQNQNNEHRSFFGDVKAGLNLGEWIFRHAGNYRWNSSGEEKYIGFATNMQHDIVPWNSRLLVGDGNTSGEMFDSFGYRGVQIGTAEQMLPDSMRGYAPNIRGIARTNAKVTVKQRGQVIYETSVPPGEFSIDDLYPTGYGGDLLVTVTEADGSKSTFSVSYASVPELLRPGRTNYSLMAGKLRNIDVAEAPYVVQGTWKRGINNYITTYLGTTSTKFYYSGMVGSAFGTPVGAISVDVNGTRYSDYGETHNGMSLRTSYSKFIASTGSTFSLAAYRFSSSGYLDLHNAVYLSDRANKHDESVTFNSLDRPRDRISLSLNQELGDKFGQLYISGYQENYWNRSGSNTQFQVGYNNSYRWLSYGLAVSRSENSDNIKETQYLLNFSIPLGRGRHSPSLNSYTTKDDGGVMSQMGLSGQLGERNQMTYNLSGGRDYNNNYSTNFNGAYRFRDATLNGSYSKGKNYYGYSAGMSGSVVAFSDGVVASPYDSLTTMGIVSAKDAKGAAIEGYPGVEINSWGLALVPYMTPYRINEVAIDPKGLPFDVDLKMTSKQVAPAQGAIVKLDYPTNKGRMVLIRATTPEGDALPFGATVTDGQGKSVGVVAQGGQIYARLNEGNERLNINWGERQHKFNCTFDLTIGHPQMNQSFERVNTICDGSDETPRQNIAMELPRDAAHG